LRGSANLVAAQVRDGDGDVHSDGAAGSSMIEGSDNYPGAGGRHKRLTLVFGIDAHFLFYWSGQQDSNLRPSAPKADALPDCAMPRPQRILAPRSARATECKCVQVAHGEFFLAT